jgi:hypothetical protein
VGGAGPWRTAGLKRLLMAQSGQRLNSLTAEFRGAQSYAEDCAKRS